MRRLKGVLVIVFLLSSCTVEEYDSINKDIDVIDYLPISEDMTWDVESSFARHIEDLDTDHFALTNIEDGLIMGLYMGIEDFNVNFDEDETGSYLTRINERDFLFHEYKTLITVQFEYKGIKYEAVYGYDHEYDKDMYELIDLFSKIDW